MENTNKGSKKEKSILVIFIIFIILVCGVAVILANSGFFNNNGRKFISLLSEKQYAFSMIQKNLSNFKDDGETSYTILIQNSSLKNLKTFMGIEKYKILNGNVEIKGATLKDKNNLDTKLTLNNNIKSEILQNDNKIVVSMSNLLSKNILIDSNDLENELKKLFDLNSETITSKEMRKMKNKYIKLIANKIKENVETKNDEKIDLNGNEYKVKMYELSLDNKQIMDLLEILINELKEDNETINYIKNQINDFNKLKNEYTKDQSKLVILTKDDVKNQLSNLLKNLQIETKINIKLYEYEDKNIKTEIELENGMDKWKINMQIEPNKENDKLNIEIEKNENKINLQYLGTLEKDSYAGKLLLNNKSELFKISLIKLKTPTRKLRKIEELNAIELSKATDEELKLIRNEIKKNLQPASKDTSRRFNIETPVTRQDEIENSKLAYKRVNPVTVKEELIMILGEPSKTKSGENEKEEYIYWTQGDGKELISAKIHGVKVYEIINDTAQNKELNLEIYKNISGDLEDVKVLENSIKSGDSYENVVKILGEKNIECLKSYLGEKEYIWYDKKGESLKIKFDKDGKVIK